MEKRDDEVRRVLTEWFIAGGTLGEFMHIVLEVIDKVDYKNY